MFFLHPYFLEKVGKKKEIYIYTSSYHAANFHSRKSHSSVIFPQDDILTPVHVLDASVNHGNPVLQFFTAAK